MSPAAALQPLLPTRHGAEPSRGAGSLHWEQAAAQSCEQTPAHRHGCSKDHIPQGSQGSAASQQPLHQGSIPQRDWSSASASSCWTDRALFAQCLLPLAIVLMGTK